MKAFSTSDMTYLSRLLEGHAASYPHDTALRVKQSGIWQDISWERYYRASQQIAYGLYSLGVRAGDRVAIQSENRPEWLYTDLACTMLRAVIVGFYPTNPVSEIQYLLNDCGASVLVAEDQEQVDKALEAIEHTPTLTWVIYLNGRGLADYDHPNLMSIDELIDRGTTAEKNHPQLLRDIDSHRSAEDLATLIYTSGTTGPPKGAMLSARNIAFAAHVFSLEGGVLGDEKLSSRDALLSYLPLSHVVERCISIWVNLHTRTVVHFAESIDTVTQDLAEVQPTLLFAVPRIWEKIQASVAIKIANASFLKRSLYRLSESWSKTIANELVRNGGTFTPRARMLYALGYFPMYRPLRKRLGLLHVRHAISGAAPISPDVLSFFLGIGVPLYEAYGMTENSAVTTSNFVGRLKLGTVGEVQPLTEVMLDEQTGEILTRSPANFMGYWNRSEATLETLDDDGWLRTGDVGEWVEGTHLRIIDRIKDIIITAGGKNISPSEIENVLKASPFVKEAVVLGDGKPFLSALIGIEFDTVADWAARKNVEYTTYRDLSEKEEVIDLIAEIVRQVNERFARVETIRQFRMLTKELDHEDGELTATQKLKRQAFASTVPHLVEDIYGGTNAYAGRDLGRNG